VTNEHLAALVNRHGGYTVIVPDVPVRFSDVAFAPGPDRFTVACVTSFGHDEPIEAVFEAARRLPDVTFRMTGNPAGTPVSLENKPANVVLTGFLDVPNYGGLLQSAGVVLALTTLDHTMLRGAYEAIYQGTPVIVSDSALLRAAFDEGAVHVANTPDAIAAAVVEVQRNREQFAAGALRLRTRKEQRWLQSKAALLAALRAARATGTREHEAFGR
jgi:glycosyltransferase involved in cell wall biosynthesis